ncbi:MAG: toll/interleukin-1 receptor domain-containing protein [Candidatus Helarchaeota archaeon]|nr:toll/interleukin-1 receptor domain-containing protein [Candidatus Helarchaeota archaeon]
MASKKGGITDIPSLLEYLRKDELKRICKGNYETIRAQTGKTKIKSLKIREMRELITESGLNEEEIVGNLTARAIDWICKAMGITRIKYFGRFERERKIKEIITRLKSAPKPKILAEEKVKSLPKIKIFISYDTEDYDAFMLEQLVEELEKNSTIEKVYYWQRDAKLGEAFDDYMTDRIEESNFFLVFCSEKSQKSSPVQQEIGMAKVAMSRGKLQVIPIFIERANLFPDFQRIRGIQFNRAKFKEFIRELLARLTREWG